MCAMKYLLLSDRWVTIKPNMRQAKSSNVDRLGSNCWDVLYHLLVHILLILIFL